MFRCTSPEVEGLPSEIASVFVRSGTVEMSWMRIGEPMTLTPPTLTCVSMMPFVEAFECQDSTYEPSPWSTHAHFTVSLTHVTVTVAPPLMQ